MDSSNYMPQVCKQNSLVELRSFRLRYLLFILLLGEMRIYLSHFPLQWYKFIYPFGGWAYLCCGVVSPPKLADNSEIIPKQQTGTSLYLMLWAIPLVLTLKSAAILATDLYV